MAGRGSSKRGGSTGRKVQAPEPVLTIWPYVDRFGRGFGRQPPVTPPPRRTRPAPEPALPWAWRQSADFARGFGKPPRRTNGHTALDWCRRHLRAVDELLRRHTWWLAPLLTLAAGVVIIIGIFVTYDDDDRRSLADVADGLIALYMTLGVGLLLIGMLLLVRRGRSAMVGAAALLALTLLTLVEFVSELVFALQTPRYGPRAGYYLQETGFLLMIVAAVLVTGAQLRPLFKRDEWLVRDRIRLATLAGGFGFATAVGYAMNPTGDRAGSFGSPIDPLAPFNTSVQIVALIALAVIPLLAVAVRQWAAAVGLTLGFSIFGLAWNLDNFFAAYEEPGGKAVEGTWTFLAASLASLLVLVYSIAAPRRQARAPVTRRITTRRPLQWAAGLAFGAAIFSLASLYPRYFDFRFNSGSDSATAMATLVVVAGFATAGAFLLQTRREMSGAVMLATIVLLVMPAPVLELFQLAERNPGVGIGYVLDKIAYGAATLGALLALWHLRKTSRRDPTADLTGWTLLAIFLGVMTGIAIGLNPFRFFGFSVGSPFLNPFVDFTFGPSSRIIWSTVLVIVAVPVIALAAMTARRAIAIGLFYGTATFVLALAMARLARAFANGGHHDAEGTWLFVSAAPALMGLVAYQLFVRPLGASKPARR